MIVESLGHAPAGAGRPERGRSVFCDRGWCLSSSKLDPGGWVTEPGAGAALELDRERSAINARPLDRDVDGEVALEDLDSSKVRVILGAGAWKGGHAELHVRWAHWLNGEAVFIEVVAWRDGPVDAQGAFDQDKPRLEGFVNGQKPRWLSGQGLQRLNVGRGGQIIRMGQRDHTQKGQEGPAEQSLDVGHRCRWLAGAGFLRPGRRASCAMQMVPKPK